MNGDLHLSKRRPWLTRQARVANRRVRRWMGRSSLYPRLELLAVVLTIVIGWSSYAYVTRRGLPANGASPSLVTALLVANLVPVMLLMVLIGRRIAILLANRRRGLAGAQLHVRLVALFAGIAAVPTLLVVIFASLLFQFGVQFWFSDRVKTILDSSNTVAQAYVEENRQRVAQDITAMATDLNGYALEFGESSPMYAKGLDYQLAARNLDEGAVFMRGRASQLTMVIGSKVTLPELVEHLRDIDLAGALIKPATLIGKGRDRIEAAVAMDPAGKRYLYISRKVDPAVLDRAARAAGALGEYNALAERSRIMQWRFNLVLMAVSLLTLAVAVWFALWLANRLVAPIAALAKAAEQVGQGDLNARVPVTAGRDEVTALSRAFNRMTAQLKSDQDELVAANRLSDARRQFIEAVLGGVSAGVMSITAAGSIRVANQSAALLLGMPAQDLAGRALVDVVPELADLLDQVRHDGQMSGQVSVARGADTLTLAVRIVLAGSGGAAAPLPGFVLTFDDITAQLADQRQAAWADVARRIAHEIKNPLTPIQLAAERLQRKFMRQLTEDTELFGMLTGTIVRQVGDLRRMVDKFSEFARLPRPVFAPEDPARLVQDVLVLQETAWPSIRFTSAGAVSVPFLCDGQQFGRLLTNLVKNAAEAIASREERERSEGLTGPAGAVHVELADDGRQLVLTVTDNGVGLPGEGRERLIEPYVTTRTRGTGLGLAIVRKIAEDHGGTLSMADAPGGGAIEKIAFIRSDVAAEQVRENERATA